MNLIYNYLYYNKIYIYSKDLTESEYEMLQDFFEEVNETMKDETGDDFQVALFSSSKDDIVNVDDLDEDYQN